MAKLSIFLLGAWVLALPAAAESSSADVAPASTCPRLFGDAHRVARNRAQRASEIETLVEGAHEVTLRHHVGRWTKPRGSRFAGLEVVEVRGEGEAAQAHVRLSGKLAALCPATEYWVGVDHSLGATGRVLGVVGRGLLVEQDRELRFVSGRETAPPRVDMVWTSPYQLVARAQSTTGTKRGRSASKAAGRAARARETAATPKNKRPEPLKSIRPSGSEFGSKAREAARERRRGADKRN